MPIVRGAGGETSGAGQGRQTLVWAQGRCSSGGRAFSADRSGAEKLKRITDKEYSMLDLEEYREEYRAEAAMEENHT